VGTLLKVENLGLAYGTLSVCRGISMEIDQGEIVALIGANGAEPSSSRRTLGS
jgi:branched-chain amino acid transport system ATP-binding protein